MNKNILAVTLLSLLTISAFVPFAMAHHTGLPWTDPMAHTIDFTGNPGSLDPAYAYDTTAAGVVMNVYENLLFFDPLWYEGPYQPSLPALQRVSAIVPQLASAMPTVDHTGGTNPISGLHWYSKFTFPIRTGVKFHHGAFADPDGAGPLMGSTGILTPRDVEYSVERVMVQDRVAGPAWLLYEPLLGAAEATAPEDDPDFGLAIDGTVEVDGNNVVFYLAFQYPDLAFEQILCQTWACIMSEAWAANEADLNMNLVTPLPGETNPWTNWEYIYNTWHAPRPSYLEDAVDKADPMKDGGTGPYRYAYWTRGTAWSIRKYDDYLAPNENLGRAQSWPAPVPGSNAPLGGYLNSITWFLVVNWPTRLSELLGGTRDQVATPRSYRDQVLGQTVGGEPIRSYYPITTLSGFALYFTFDINPAAVPGYVPVLRAPNTFGTDGIPPNIFGLDTVTGKDEGMNVRKAFICAWDYGYGLSAGNLNEAVQPPAPIVDGLAYYNPAQPKPAYSLTKTEYYLKLAWGGIDDRSGVPGQPVLPEDPTHITTTGALWNGGMRFSSVWSTGSVAYMLCQQKMNAEINALNPTKFFLSDRDVDWGTIFLPDEEEHKLPVYNVGWLADFADPHNFAYPFMHSEGTFGGSQVISITQTANGLRQVFVDELITQGILTADTPVTYTVPSGSTVEDWIDRDKSGGTSANTGDWIRVSGNWYEKQADGSGLYDRQMIYYELQEVYVDEGASSMVFQTMGRGFQNAWCRGYYDNKLFPGNYWYHWWKGKTHFGDVDWDGLVGGNDRSVISNHWGGPPAGTGGFNLRADVTGGTAGTVGSETGLVKGVPDGKVSMSDLSLVSAYWDIPPGPSHPTLP